jgi:hypothetical protein
LARSRAEGRPVFESSEFWTRFCACACSADCISVSKTMSDLPSSRLNRWLYLFRRGIGLVSLKRDERADAGGFLAHDNRLHVVERSRRSAKVLERSYAPTARRTRSRTTARPTERLPFQKAPESEHSPSRTAGRIEALGDAFLGTGARSRAVASTPVSEFASESLDEHRARNALQLRARGRPWQETWFGAMRRHAAMAVRGEEGGHCGRMVVAGHPAWRRAREPFRGRARRSLAAASAGDHRVQRTMAANCPLRYAVHLMVTASQTERVREDEPVTALHSRTPRAGRVPASVILCSSLKSELTRVNRRTS